MWFDDYELMLGDSLRGAIGDGLRHSRVGVVILSPSFFSKRWPQWELDGLTARQIAGEPNVILPVWHEVGPDDVRSYSAPLADLVAAKTSDGVDAIADQIVRVLNRLAAGGTPEQALSYTQASVTESEVADRPESSTKAKLPSRPSRLIEALSDHDESVRFEAMSALGNRLSPDLLPVIEPLLDDRDNYIRRMAVDYYAQLGGD